MGKKIKLITGNYASRILKSNVNKDPEYEYYRQMLWESIKRKSKFIPVEDLKVYEGWVITEKQFDHPNSIDQQRYNYFINLPYQEWLPLIIDQDNLVLDGYHRLAVAVYFLNKKEIRVILDKDLTEAENLFIMSGIIKNEKGRVI